MTATAAPRIRSAPLLTAPRRPGAARLAAFAPLSAFAASVWGASLVAPGGGGRGALMALIASAAGAAMLGAARLRHPLARHGAAALALVVALALMLEAAGVGARLLAPDAWGELVAGIGQGIGSLPNASVPYRGADAWVRTTILAGAGALLLLGAAAALWPRRAASTPTAAAVLLAVVYAVPVVERNVGHPFASGAAFSLLVAGLLWGERLERDHAWIAATLGAVAVVGGLLVAPRLDGARPLLDPQHIADSLADQHADTFTWDHRYTPLDWPREGREVLRVKARNSSYWKTVNLTEFDGRRWIQALVVNPRLADTEVAAGHPGWTQTITVVVRHLKSPEYVTAGSASRVSDTPHAVVMESPGTFVTGRHPLVPGDSYRARVYTPRPSQAQLRDASTHYPSFTQADLTVELPRSVGGPVARNPFNDRVDRRFAAEIVFPSYGEPAEPLTYFPDATSRRNGSTMLGHSRLARTYALARRLVAQSDGPYDFVRRVERRVHDGAHYSESPPPAALPLDDFLFGHRIGYCQQFSGAMALLLRMGGIPARVASGFSPGTYDRTRKDYVVRDLDAHSWVEAYFPAYGWVPFDPTPSIAPASSQSTSDRKPSAAGGDAADRGGKGDRASDPHAGGAVAGDGAPAWRWPLIVGLAGALLALSMVRLDRRGRPPRPPVDPELAELVQALRRSGRTPSGDTTLKRLEMVLGGSDDAIGYLRAVRTRRFGGPGAPVPTRAQRAALRRELAAGLGPIGRLRAWWALPPRVLNSKAWPTATSSSATGRASWRRATSTLRRSR